jgi:RES domain
MAAVWFRSCDSRWPFLWDSDAQRPGRWHGEGEGPVQYLADTPDGAWAEFLRHEEIADPGELRGIERGIWAVEVPDDEPPARPALDAATLRGGLGSYAACQAEARRLRSSGARSLGAPSAALLPGGARGQSVREGALVEARRRDGRVLALFGARPALRGWRCAHGARPHERLLALVRHL